MYSQLQTILPDSFLGDISDWDRFLSIDLSSDLPFKSVTDFLRNKDFADLVNKSDLPTPTHFVEQALCFYKSLCTLLLKHSIRKSKLIRGMSVFDEAVILHGREEDYEEESDQLCDFLIQRDWISSSIKPLILSEYRSFFEKFRSCEVQYDTDWVTFMSGYYELQCRTDLFSVFKLCCLGISSSICIPPVFTVALPDLASDNCDFTSAVRSVQSSLVGIPNVLGLFSNPRTVAPIFSLLGKGRSLLENPDYSVWDVSSSYSSRRLRLQNKFESCFTCTVTDEERAWTSLDVDPKPSGSTSSSPTHRVTSSTSKSPKTPLPSSKFAVPGPIPVGLSGGSSRGFDQTLQLATATLAVPRFVSEVPFPPPDQTKSAKKLTIKKRPSPGGK